MEPNIPLLRKTLEYIEEHPDEWNQDSWAERRSGCGTTMCVAGTAAYLSGANLVWTAGGAGDISFVEATSCRTEDGLYHDIEDYATDLLGLTPGQANAIFYSNPADPQKLRELVEKVIDRAL